MSRGRRLGTRVTAALESVGRWVTPERARVYPLTVVICLLLAGLVAPALGPSLGFSEAPLAGGDFAAFYTAGHAVSHHHAEVLTDLAQQERYQRELLERPHQSKWSPWVSPPLLAYAFSPLADLPFAVAAALELSLLALALALALAWLRRDLPGLPSSAKLFFYALAFFPLFASLLYQQLTALFLLALVGMLHSLRERQAIRAGLWLGVFAVKPQLALGLGLYLLFQKRFLAAGVALGVACAFFGASYLILPDATSRWLLHAPALFAYLRQGGYPTWGQFGALGSAALLFDALSPSLATGVGVMFTLGLVVALWRLAASPPSAAGPLAAALALALCLSPHLYVYDLGLLMVPFALLYSAGLHQRDDVRGALALVYVFCFAGTFLSMVEVDWTREAFGHGTALQLGVLAILLAAWASASGGEEARAQASSTTAVAGS